MKLPSLIPAFLLLAICTAFFVLPAPPASAQTSLSITEQGVENQFPDGLRFYISANSDSPIEEIRVYVQKLGQSTRSSYRSIEFEPGNSVSGEVLFRSKTANEYIPTGTRLSYHFDLRTADGGVSVTEPETVVYLNTGLDWQSTSIGLINVYYYNHDQWSEQRANLVLATAVDTYAFMAPALGVDLTEPMNIVVYSDYGHMLDALQPASRVAAQRLRTLGKAFTNERTLLVDGSLDNILTTAAHEFTHLLVADAAGSAYTEVHAWLNEGLAVYSERNPDDDFSHYIQAAIRRGDVPPLAGLITFSGTPGETLRNYGQGYSVVTYLVDTYGPDKMADLFAALPTVRSTERALQDAYGLTIQELDQEWRASVGLPERAAATPALPPLQIPATSRPGFQVPRELLPTQSAVDPTAPATAPGVAAAAEPTHTPRSAPQQAEPTPAPVSSGGCSNPDPGATDRVSPELAALGLLAFPVGLGALAVRRRRGK